MHSNRVTVSTCCARRFFDCMVTLFLILLFVDLLIADEKFSLARVETHRREVALSQTAVDARKIARQTVPHLSSAQTSTNEETTRRRQTRQQRQMTPTEPSLRVGPASCSCVIASCWSDLDVLSVRRANGHGPRRIHRREDWLLLLPPQEGSAFLFVDAHLVALPHDEDALVALAARSERGDLRHALKGLTTREVASVPNFNAEQRAAQRSTMHTKSGGKPVAEYRQANPWRARSTPLRLCLSACCLPVCVRVWRPSRRVCRDDLRCSRHELHSDERRVMTAQRVDLLLSERRPHAHLVIGAGAQQKTILVRIRNGDHTSAAQTHGQTQGRAEKSNEQWPCQGQN